uniref:Pyruvate, water dikinase n=1 Tax=Steinernema glaseri TaxID=37863 RepID=A0A1I7ZF02_9BILA
MRRQYVKAGYITVNAGFFFRDLLVKRNFAPPGEDLTTLLDAPTIQAEANVFHEDMGDRVQPREPRTERCENMQNSR